jgi:hypothetical protein
LLCLACRASAGGPGGAIAWQEDYAAGRARAAALARPLLVSVSSAGCPPCRQLEAATYGDPAVAGVVARELVPVRLDAGRDAALVAALKVQSFPLTIFAGPDGSILHMVAGYVGPQEMLAHIEEALSRLRWRRAEPPPGGAAAPPPWGASGPGVADFYAQPQPWSWAQAPCWWQAPAAWWAQGWTQQAYPGLSAAPCRC